jgi:hypothetical protein
MRGRVSRVHRILGIRPIVTPAQALTLAQGHCDERELPWREPISIRFGLRRYHIMTASNMRGGNVFIAVDCETGQVEASRPTPR